MFKKIILCSSLAFSLAVAAPLVFADDTSSNTAPSTLCQKRMDFMNKTLQLSSDQQAKIKAIHDSGKAAMKANWQQLKGLKDQMKQLVASDKLDQGQLDTLVQQKTALMGTMMKARVTLQNQVYNVLNDQQKKQFHDAMAKWEAQKKEWHKGC